MNAIWFVCFHYISASPKRNWHSVPYHIASWNRMLYRAVIKNHFIFSSINIRWKQCSEIAQYFYRCWSHVFTIFRLQCRNIFCSSVYFRCFYIKSNAFNSSWIYPSHLILLLRRFHLDTGKIDKKPLEILILHKQISKSHVSDSSFNHSKSINRCAVFFRFFPFENQYKW